MGEGSTLTNPLYMSRKIQIEVLLKLGNNGIKIPSNPLWGKL